MNKATTVDNPLGIERVGRLLARYAIPSIIALIINSLYNMVDQIFIGQGVGFWETGQRTLSPRLRRSRLRSPRFLVTDLQLFLVSALERERVRKQRKDLGHQSFMEVSLALSGPLSLLLS